MGLLCDLHEEALRELLCSVVGLLHGSSHPFLHGHGLVLHSARLFLPCDLPRITLLHFAFLSLHPDLELLLQAWAYLHCPVPVLEAGLRLHQPLKVLLLGLLEAELSKIALHLPAFLSSAVFREWPFNLGALQ